MNKEKKTTKETSPELIESEEERGPKRQPCEVYSRIVGYLRPVNQWNEGKQAEFSDRKEYAMNREAIEKKEQT